MSNVLIRECPDYNAEKVRAVLESAIEELGGLDWVRPDMRIGVKLNLCAAMKPEAAATTHPVMAAELTKMLVARGAEVILGDSPGGPFIASMINRTYNVCGMRLCEEACGKLNDDYSHITVPFPEGVSVKTFDYVNWMHECDEIISFCKLKSHGLMGMTGAVKNLYGVIPGTYKSEYHYRHTDPADFADMLVDLNEYVKPRLCLCDAVEIMEGNGPTMGTPRHLGLLLASDSPYELDRLGAALLGFRESEIPFLIAAEKRGLTDGTDYSGMAAPYRIPDFVRSGATASWFIRTEQDTGIRKIVKRVMYLAMCSKPAPDKSCIGCGHCAEGCPAKAIVIKNGSAVIDRSKCIKCFCCQEFCPTGAMKVQRSPIAKLLGR